MGTMAMAEHKMSSRALHLARWFVVALDDQLYTIRADLEAVKELEHIQLAGIVRQALDLDDAIALTDNWLHKTPLYQASFQNLLIY